MIILDVWPIGLRVYERRASPPPLGDLPVDWAVSKPLFTRGSWWCKIRVSMRFIAIAIITLTVFLTLQPCQEVQAISPANGAAASFVHVAGTEDCEDGECSPFCICSCCSHLVSYHVPEAAFNVTRTAEAEPRAVLLIRTFSPRSFKNSVWQPPKY